MELMYENHRISLHSSSKAITQLQHWITHNIGLAPNDFYLVSNGRKLTENTASGIIHIVPRILGGKGGFGSMLRAIGAQIEKTTNREACRDLSGRRLRDINEEQRLKKWVAQQAEREKEAKQKKKKKLEKLLEQPRHEFKDEEYDKERSALPERVEDAVLKGLEASCSSSKRKHDDDKSKIVKKKPKLWLDNEVDEDISSSGSDNEEVCDSKPSTSNSTTKLHNSALSAVYTDRKLSNETSDDPKPLSTELVSRSDTNKVIVQAEKDKEPSEGPLRITCSKAGVSSKQF